MGVFNKIGKGFKHLVHKVGKDLQTVRTKIGKGVTTAAKFVGHKFVQAAPIVSSILDTASTVGTVIGAGLLLTPLAPLGATILGVSGAAGALGGVIKEGGRFGKALEEGKSVKQAFDSVDKFNLATSVASGVGLGVGGTLGKVIKGASTAASIVRNLEGTPKKKAN